MKSDLEIIHKLTANQMATHRSMAETLAQRMPNRAAECRAAAAALDGTLQNIDILIEDRPNPDAGDDHGSALACAEAWRDRYRTSMVEHRDALAYAQTALAEVRSERDAALALVTAELEKSAETVDLRDDLIETLRRNHIVVLNELRAETDRRFYSQEETIDRVRTERDRYDAECNDLKAALTSVEGGRDQLNEQNKNQRKSIEIRDKTLARIRLERNSVEDDAAEARGQRDLIDSAMNRYRLLLLRIQRGDVFDNLCHEIKEALA